MPSIKHTTVISAQQEFLFDYSQRKSCRLDWDPFVSSVKLHDGADMPQKGTLVTVHTWNYLSMTCEYIQYQRTTRIAIQMLKGPFLLEVFGGTWHFEPLSDQETQATFEYTFRLKPIFGKAILSKISKIYFTWDMKRRLLALKKGAEAAFAKQNKIVVA